MESPHFVQCVVATIAAMKSGLKAKSTDPCSRSVATIAAMKSGLKDVLSTRVATIAPMKRGLKVMTSRDIRDPRIDE